MSAPHKKTRRQTLFNMWLAAKNNATIQYLERELNKNNKSTVKQFRRKQYKNTAKKWLASQNNNETAALERKLTNMKNPKKSYSDIYRFSNYNIARERRYAPINQLQNEYAREFMPPTPAVSYQNNSSDTNNYYNTNNENENWIMVSPISPSKKRYGRSRRRTNKKKQ